MPEVPSLVRSSARLAHTLLVPAVALLSMIPASLASAQGGTPPAADSAWTTEADHPLMLEQLGIRALRPGPSGNESDANHANHANYDEAKANPHVPAVRWSETERDSGIIAGHAVIARQLAGRVDNSAFPQLSVDIAATLVLPSDAKRPVPVMIMFRPAGIARALGRPVPPPQGRPAFVVPPPPAGSDAPATDQLIADGWGFVVLDPASIQEDRGAGLRRGIIGLTNKGEPRRPDQWGALRAWGWGASRVLDYLHAVPGVDVRRVGIEGVSRYGKAALVTMAFDERFAAVLIGSSGEGGAKLHRRNFGEAVENLTGAGEYHWMAGNFLAYGASDARAGARNAGDLPVDAHELLALCAPRLTFVSYGIPERGDARWLDQRGSFMAAVAAQPVFRLLGARALGVPDDHRNAVMPPVNVGLLDGALAWRQHDGGHTDAPNWKYFLSWADFHLGRRCTPTANVQAPVTAPAATPAGDTAAQQQRPRADVPAARTDSNSAQAHRDLMAKRTQGKIDLYFVGNSITRRWGATDYPDMLANWRENFFGWNAADFGWGADRIENMLWRIEQGELDGVNPKVIVISAGTNNVGSRPGDDEKVADITRGIRALIALCQAKAPRARIILMGIFPRNDDKVDPTAVIPEIDRINANIARMADGTSIRYLNINDKLADSSGRLFDGLTMDRLHPTVKGYQIWADALKPILTEWLGPRKATDEAPPPTGDPSAKRR